MPARALVISIFPWWLKEEWDEQVEREHGNDQQARYHETRRDDSARQRASW